MSNHEIRQNVRKTLEELKPKIGLKSPEELRQAALHSVRGFLEVLFTEKAFRTDLVIFAVCVAVAAATPGLSWCERALLIYTAFVPLVAELINTAIETTIDRISFDYHRLSGLAKDIGSALVLLSFVGTGICWFVIFLGWTLRTFVK